MRFMFALLFYAINIFIQGELLLFIVRMLAMPAFKSAQDLYMNFHDEAFENGEFSPARFHDFPDEQKSDLCHIAVAQSFITKILIFLWISQNMGEFVFSFTMLGVICGMPHLPDDCPTTEMVVDKDETEKEEFWVICLNLNSKVLLQLLVYLPKMLIALVLGFTGSLWLLAAQDSGELLLNSLALGFVTNVDEILATIFFPACFSEVCLQPFAYRFYSRSKGTSHKNELSYVLGIVKLVVTLAIVELLYHYQPVIPGYQRDIPSACEDYMQQELPWCYPFESKSCFPTRGS